MNGTMTIDRTLTQIHSHVWRLVAPNASPMTGPGTNTYLVGGQRLIIIDPGLASETHLENIVVALHTLKAEAQAIVVTHPHSDHSGGATALAQRLGMPLLSLGDPLRAMLALAPADILPGHGPVIEDPPTLLQEYIDHRLQREQQVLDWLAQGYTTAAEIAARIYADRPEALGIATLQVEAHLEKLRREGRA